MGGLDFTPTPRKSPGFDHNEKRIQTRDLKHPGPDLQPFFYFPRPFSQQTRSFVDAAKKKYLALMDKYWKSMLSVPKTAEAAALLVFTGVLRVG